MTFEQFVLIAILVVILIALAWYIHLGHQIVNGETQYTEKNVTVTVGKGEMFIVFFGNPDRANGVTNSWQMDKRQLSEIENVIEAFVNDRVERSYKIEVP